MKITKSQLKQLIVEEVAADAALLDAIGGLSKRIEDLDVSIDFLASAFVGVPATSIAATQRNVGRYAHVPKIRFGGDKVEETKRIIKEELEKMLAEEGAACGPVEEPGSSISNIYKWCPAGTKCPPASQKTTWWKGK